MEKLTEVVIALLMIVQGEIKEHRIQESMSDCLKGKRVASRNISSSVEYQCIKSMAEIEVDKLGSKHINKLILD
tara:strand:- start:219 stop:440 length:222 start_codon:yes stop_codon:yes gene_type:complete